MILGEIIIYECLKIANDYINFSVNQSAKEFLLLATRNCLNVH
jgi:hypothetical protein